MALTLTAETGSGSASANSYCTVADADTYHEAHIYAHQWDQAESGKKTAALIWATRLLDETCNWDGERATSAQALRWPRANCPNADDDDWISSSSIPTWLKIATAFQARALIEKNRPAVSEDVAEGSRSVAGKSAARLKADNRFRSPLSPEVWSLVRRFCRSGDADLVRTS